MSWVYGSELCMQPHIPVCDWVYGDEVCITLPTVVYPTSAKVRVTNLIHRWSPGEYTLQIGLGDLTTEFTIDDVILRPPVPAIVPEPGPIPGPAPGPSDCEYQGSIYPQGSYTCMGDDKYVCFEGRWLLSLKNAPECKKIEHGCMYRGTSHPEGSYVCMGSDKYVCFEGRWIIALTDAPECKGA